MIEKWNQLWEEWMKSIQNYDEENKPMIIIMFYVVIGVLFALILAIGVSGIVKVVKALVSIATGEGEGL